jgi:hypothetical protein
MASFQFCYNLNKHVPNRDFWLGLHPTSWVTAVIGPLARVIFVVSSLAPEHDVKPGHSGSRSGYRSIGKH